MGADSFGRDFIGLALVVLLLGMRHGLDADHLAAIDGLSRSNASRRPRLARSAGLLFSLGHGSVVLAVALLASTLTSAWRVPAWIEGFGAWMSISILVALALVNINAVFVADARELPSLVGWRTGVFARLFSAASAAAVLGVGAFFALSFDTLSQATLFAVASARYGGPQAAALLALCFVVGMLAVDGLNGLWIWRLIRRSDRRARVASRVMSLSVAGVGLLTAAVGAAVQTSQGFAAWSEGKEIWFGPAVIAVVWVSFLIARQLAAESAPGFPAPTESGLKA